MKNLDYKADLYERLKDSKKYAVDYFNLALNDEDPRVLLLAMKDIIEARSSIAHISDKTGLNREHIYRMLSVEGNPSMFNVIKIIQALGIYLKAAQMKQSKAIASKNEELIHDSARG